VRLSLSSAMQDTGTAPTPAVPKSKHEKRMRVGSKTYVVTLTRDEYMALHEQPPVIYHQGHSVPGLITGVEVGSDNSTEVEAMRGLLRERMSDLTGQEQEALILHYSGVTYRAMGVKLGVSTTTAFRLVRGALAQLRTLKQT
jgi:DNA-directed RNA polymerase specialized sigma24 family protein